MRVLGIRGPDIATLTAFLPGPPTAASDGSLFPSPPLPPVGDRRARGDALAALFTETGTTPNSNRRVRTSPLVQRGRY